MNAHGGLPSSNATLDQRSVNEDYWRSVAVNDRLGLTDATALWDWLRAGDFSSLAGRELVAGTDLFFRGQSDIAYGLTSSLYRELRDAKPVGTITEHELGTAERALVAGMRKQGLGRNMTDFQLITVLQHHLMPTRLIDVSRSPLESLYFAVENHHGTDGVLFLINPRAVEGVRFTDSDLPWAHFKSNEKYGDSNWTNKVAVAEHEALDPRMTAQNGTFLVGGLLRSYSGMAMYNRNGDIPTPRRADVTTLAVRFLKRRQHDVGSEWGAAGWVIRVDPDWKRDLLGMLAELDEPISHDTMYPAFTETARLAKYIVSTTARTAAGATP